MTQLYAYGQGFDVALADLTLFSPQPRSGEIMNAERVPAISGFVVPRGANIAILTFSVLKFDWYDTLNTGLGISLNSPSAEVTLYTKLNTATTGVQNYARFNAIATLPQHGGKDITRPVAPAWFDAKYTFRLLQQLTEP